MKRFHVHIAVDDLATSIRFYNNLFGMPPSVEKTDYAKWMLEDPKVNFAISNRGREAGLDHLGIQVEEQAELAEVTERLKSADEAVVEQEAACCYANSKKSWANDPSGIAWETFLTTGENTTYGDASSQSCEVPRIAKSRKVMAIKSCCAPS